MMAAHAKSKLQLIAAFIRTLSGAHTNFDLISVIVEFNSTPYSEGAHAAQKHSNQLIVDSVPENSSKDPGHKPNQHESSCTSLLAVQPKSHKSNETHSSSLLLSQSEGAGFAPTTTF